MAKLISIVVPAYNEAEGLPVFHNDILMPEINRLKSYSFNVVYVDDGSTDKTLDVLHDIAKRDKKVSIIALSRNFGKEVAITAGIHEAKGDAVIVMDADGQHPPSYISEFIGNWESGSKVVVGVRQTNSHESLVKKYGSKIFYSIFNKSSGVNLVPGSTDYRLIDRVVVEEFRRCLEKNRITRGIIDWLGFDRSYVYFNSPDRIAGSASYSTSKLVNLAINSFVSLSIRPLVWLIYSGIMVTLLGIFVLLFTVIEVLVVGDPLGLNPSGTAYLAMFMMILVGLVLVSQGVIGIYISRIHEQSQARPLFVIDSTKSTVS